MDSPHLSLTLYSFKSVFRKNKVFSLGNYILVTEYSYVFVCIDTYNVLLIESVIRQY